nr:uncharacterized protein LOC116820781 [Chelonoidis abingdonii]
MRKKQMFDRSVSYSDDSVTKLQYYTGDSERENDPGSEQGGDYLGSSHLDYDNMEEPALNDVPQTPDSREVPALPGDDPGDGYDDAREISDSEDDPGSGLSSQEVTVAHRGSVRNWESQTGTSKHQLEEKKDLVLEKAVFSTILKYLQVEEKFHIPTSHWKVYDRLLCLVSKLETDLEYAPLPAAFTVCSPWPQGRKYTHVQADRQPTSQSQEQEL